MSKPDQQRADWRNLRETVRAIHAAHPTATAAHFVTSDQQVGYGFVLTRIAFEGGAECDPSDELFCKVADLVGDIDWDDVMEEDASGHAKLRLDINRPARRFRVLKESAGTPFYDTLSRCEAAAQRFADRDGETVYIERWSQAIELHADPVNGGWGTIGHREPSK